MFLASGTIFTTSPLITSLILQLSIPALTSIPSLSSWMDTSPEALIGILAISAVRLLMFIVLPALPGIVTSPFISIGIANLPSPLSAANVLALADILTFLFLSLIPRWSSPNASVSPFILPAAKRLSILNPILLFFTFLVFSLPLNPICLRLIRAASVSLLSV